MKDKPGSIGDQLSDRAKGSEHQPEAAEFSPDIENEREIVWHGEWTSDGFGVNEARSSVAFWNGSYRPGLEVSFQGGDCDVRYGDAFSTLDEAKKAAQKREADWHMRRDGVDDQDFEPIQRIKDPTDMGRDR